MAEIKYAAHYLLRNKITASVRDKAKQLLKRFTGLTCYRRLPFGVDVFHDIAFKLKDYRFHNFVDVGANKGQSARYIRSCFPHARIHCLEPIKDTFEILKGNGKKLNLICHNVALGASKGEVEVEVDVQNRLSTRNSLVKENNVHSATSVKTETVQVLTLTNFCELNNIREIDFLKIDTEGYDLEVLKGATELLESNAVSFIQAEVSMNPHNTFHVDFVEVKKFLESYNYVLFGIYEQKQERDIPMLRRSNVVFISGKLTGQARV